MRRREILLTREFSGKQDDCRFENSEDEDVNVVVGINRVAPEREEKRAVQAKTEWILYLLCILLPSEQRSDGSFMYIVRGLA